MPDTINGSGKLVTLRIVKNVIGSTLTIARRCVKFDSSTAKAYGGRTSGYVDTAGMVGKPIDDAMKVGAVIPANDLFYVVDEGPCKVENATGAFNLAAGVTLTPNATGQIGSAACAAGQFSLGVLDQALNNPATTGPSLIYVTAGIAKPDAVG